MKITFIKNIPKKTATVRLVGHCAENDLGLRGLLG